MYFLSNSQIQVQRTLVDEDDEPVYSGKRVRTISEIQREESSLKRKGKKSQHVELPKLPLNLREQIDKLNIDDREPEEFDVPDGTASKNRRPIYEMKVNR